LPDFVISGFTTTACPLRAQPALQKCTFIVPTLRVGTVS
jgi:hypothetical protein